MSDNILDEIGRVIVAKADAQNGKWPTHIVLDPVRYDRLIEQVMLDARAKNHTLETRHGFILFLDVEVERA